MEKQFTFPDEKSVKKHKVIHRETYLPARGQKHPSERTVGSSRNQFNLQLDREKVV